MWKQIIKQIVVVVVMNS